MTRIVIDPDELDRFAALSVEAAEDYASRAEMLRALEMTPLPPEVASVVGDGIARVATTLDGLSAALHAEALVLRARAGALDPILRRYLVSHLAGRPG